MKEQPKSFACYYPLEKCDHQCPGCRFRKLDEVTTPKVEAISTLLSRVSGEPPKPDPNISKAIYLLQQVALADEDMVKIDGAAIRYRELAREALNILFERKVSGEAKTPDLLIGHEVENLKRCEICYDLADKYFGEGNDEDGGAKMHAVDFAHFVIEQLKLVNELTGGSVPTPDWMEAHNTIMEDNLELYKQVAELQAKIKELSVPTPSDELCKKLFEYVTNYTHIGGEQRKCWRDDLIEEYQEWLRGSTEQRLGNSGNKS